MTSPGPPLQVMSLRIVVGALAGGAVLMAAVAGILNGFDERPGATWLGVLLAGSVLCWLLALTVGFRVPAIEPGSPHVERQAMSALTSSTVQRTMLTEAPAILGLVLSLASGSGLVAVIGLLTVPVMLWLSWPSRANVAKVERRVDAKGARSGLSEALFGQGSGPTGGAMLPH